MNNQELCSTCKPFGYCVFERNAELVVKKVPKRQTPLVSGSKISAEAAEAHKAIAVLREKARGLSCPKVNEVNPDYPGKSSL